MPPVGWSARSRSRDTPGGREGGWADRGRGVLVHVVLGPGGDGVHLDQTAGLVPRDDRRGGPGEGVHPLESGHPGLAAFEGTIEGYHLAHLAAAVAPTGEGVRLGPGGEHPEVQVVATADVLDVVEGLGEMESGVEEEHLDTRVDLRGQVDNDAVLEGTGQRNAASESFDGPGDDLARRRRLELVGACLQLLR